MVGVSGIGWWVGVVDSVESCALEVVLDAACNEDGGDVFAEVFDEIWYGMVKSVPVYVFWVEGFRVKDPEVCMEENVDTTVVVV